jgi:hypothetical protein
VGFSTIFRIITTSDLAAALRFYRDLLGATVWGERVARVLGPDGNRVIVGRRVATTQDAS